MPIFTFNETSSFKAIMGETKYTALEEIIGEEYDHEPFHFEVGGYAPAPIFKSPWCDPKPLDGLKVHSGAVTSMDADGFTVVFPVELSFAGEWIEHKASQVD